MLNSKFFKRNEFSCKCGCSMDTIDAELLYLLDTLRAYFGVPITVNSACRCLTHNMKVGGKKNSQHLLSKAADIVVKDVPPNEVYNHLACKYKGAYGIGNYIGFTHIDVRSTKARW